MQSETIVSITAEGNTSLEGELAVPEGPRGLVLFAHGSGSSRHSPRNNFVADVLHDRDLATLLFDLLTEQEDRDRSNRFDVPLLTDRLRSATDWVAKRPAVGDLPRGYFGASTGAAAALRAAARRHDVDAVVSRGGRVDMAEEALDDVTTPTLLVVGGEDTDVLERNREAYERLSGEKSLEVVAGAGHLFEEPGALEAVAEHAVDWFETHL